MKEINENDNIPYAISAMFNFVLDVDIEDDEEEEVETEKEDWWVWLKEIKRNQKL